MLASPQADVYHCVMFALSKAVLSVVNPTFLVPFLLVIGAALLWSRWRRAGRWILTVTAAVVGLASALPIGDLMIGTLENRFPTVHSLPAHVDGIVVLGGTVNQFMTRARGQPSLKAGAGRLTEFIALARRHPEARLVFTGGSGSPTRPDVKETEVARMLFEELGLDTSRVIFEDQARNTWENALYTSRLVRPKPGETWVLVTSAEHMPRAVGCFRKVGWNPLPYPVDYQTYGSLRYHMGFDMLGGLWHMWEGMREWMALAVYRLLGRTDTFFPAPRRSGDGDGGSHRIA